MRRLSPYLIIGLLILAPFVAAILSGGSVQAGPLRQGGEGEPVTPETDFGTFVINLRLDLELLADEAEGPNVRPAGWNGNTDVTSRRHPGRYLAGPGKAGRRHRRGAGRAAARLGGRDQPHPQPHRAQPAPRPRNSWRTWSSRKASARRTGSARRRSSPATSPCKTCWTCWAGPSASYPSRRPPSWTTAAPSPARRSTRWRAKVSR